jgi:hypothetical protein
MGWYIVRVSARVLRWPPGCVSCGGASDGTLYINSTRVTGVRVLRSQTRGWRVPCCSRCLWHMKAEGNTRRFLNVARRLTLLGPVACAVGLVAGSAVVGLLLAFLMLARRDGDAIHGARAAAAVLLPLALVAGGTLLAIVVYRPWSAHVRGEREKQLEIARKIHASAKAACLPTCCALAAC